MQKELASIKDAANRYGCSTRTIRRLIENGTIQAYRLGPRTTRIDLTEADKKLLTTKEAAISDLG